jgi:hypothetical protein
LVVFSDKQRLEKITAAINEISKMRMATAMQNGYSHAKCVAGKLQGSTTLSALHKPASKGGRKN